MRHLLAAALVLLLIPSIAFAGKGEGRGKREGKRDPAKMAERIMSRLDANKDGRLSRDEAKSGPRMEKIFDRVDADRDGFVSKAELVAALEKLQKRRERDPKDF
jgi:Ca2+-binding EF-hand superfamily protein